MREFIQTKVLQETTAEETDGMVGLFTGPNETRDTKLKLCILPVVWKIFKKKCLLLIKVLLSDVHYIY